MENASEKCSSVKEEARPSAENEKGQGVREIGRKGNSLGQVSWKIEQSHQVRIESESEKLV